ncbi:RING-H2 finger protein ATL5-like [Euphorbia lathyris]|uniref:RING-H2 finger protein ATL5-like n=1 Tax=Euphorbia lathyris TaxID=212925 RepID=UPI0033132E01
MENTNGNGFPQPRDQVSSLNAYASNGKIMLFSGIILFIAILLILCFHAYTRWIFNLRRRRHHILSLSLSNVASAAAAAKSQGLDPSILKSLPVLVYNSETHEAVLECAVCLSEFEDGEIGRVLPACNHTFHSCCIDMWFQSHSNCPLCRAPVQYDMCKIGSDTVIPVLGMAEMEKKVENERFCSASSPPVRLSLLQCQRIASELVEILVEVPTSSRERPLVESGPSGRIGPQSTTPNL